jgi:alkylation response protein AidB-like acyl-CoA dehydrogenase
MGLVEQAERLAEEVLFPNAQRVDAGEYPLTANLDRLAAGGWYGLVAPPGFTALPEGDFPTICRAVETVAGGCLSTAFVWIQHFSALMAAANSQMPGITQTWLEPLATGARRAGIAIGAAVRPGPPSLRAKQTGDGGYLFDGEADWVTGWGLIDTLYAAARDEQDTIVWALIEPHEGASLVVEPLSMVAVMATNTVKVRFHQHSVAAEQITGSMPYAEWATRDRSGLRFNGNLAMGVAQRALRLLGPSPLDAEFDAARAALDTGTPETLPVARAAASELALRAAAALVVSGGSRSVLTDQTAQRLLREAGFLLVFGSRPPIKAALLTTLRAKRP